MQDLENIQLRQFKIVRSLNGAHVILVQDSGEGARISSDDLVRVFLSLLTPSIEGGEWFIGSEPTGVSATARNLVIRKNGAYLEWKYDDEPVTQYRTLMPIADLAIKFSDLTAEQRDSLTLHYSDLTPEQIAALQKPATDAASEWAELSTQIKQAESDRNTNEHSRIEAEKSRAKTFSELLDGIVSANRSEFEPRIQYLETHSVQAVPTELYDDEVDISSLM